MLKIYLSQMLSKTTSMCKAQQDLFNGVSFMSNRNHIQNLFSFEVWKKKGKKGDDVVVLIVDISMLMW